MKRKICSRSLLKKRNAKINEMPSFKLTTNFGKKIKRDFDDFSDINFDFNDKDKFFQAIIMSW